MLAHGFASRLSLPVTDGGVRVGTLQAFAADERPWTRFQVSRARVIALALGAALTRTGALGSEPGLTPPGAPERIAMPKASCHRSTVGAWSRSCAWHRSRLHADAWRSTARLSTGATPDKLQLDAHPQGRSGHRRGGRRQAHPRSRRHDAVDRRRGSRSRRHPCGRSGWEQSRANNVSWRVANMGGGDRATAYSAI